MARFQSTIAAASLSLAAFASTATAAALDVKTGLWEISYTTQIRGVLLPQAQLDALTPEQRARIEAMTEQQSAQGPQTATTKSCLTAEELSEGAFQADDEEDCTNTPGEHTSSIQEVTVVCTGENSRRGEFRVEALDREHITGAFTSTGDGGHVTMQLEGKWVSESCAGADDD